MRTCLLPIVAISALTPAYGQPSPRMVSDPPVIESSWDDLTDGIKTSSQWQKRRAILKQRYMDLLRNQYKPAKPPLDLQVHDTVVVDGQYTRKLISYAVEHDERAHAYLGIPLNADGKTPGIVALHGTYVHGKQRVAGLIDNPNKAYMDHLCRRGYVAIAPEHFVSGHRTPSEGAYETGRFYKKHPNWTAVGKFTFEHSIAVDVLQTLDEVDTQNIGALGHSLGGHGTLFLAAYDERIKASACNCGASFFVTTRASMAGLGTIGMSISNISDPALLKTYCHRSTSMKSSL